MGSMEPYSEPAPRTLGSRRASWMRLMLVLAGFGLVWLIWLISHPLGPGSVSISIAGHTQFAAGAAETIKITMNSVHGDPFWTSVDWGDGRNDTNPNKNQVFGGPCVQRLVPTDGSTPPPIPHVNVATWSPGHGDVEFLHRYRRPGTYRVTVHADEFFWVCTNQRSPSRSATIILHVTGPAASGNGPGEPNPGVGLISYNNGLLVGDVEADDEDGYVRWMMVTWPDGSTRKYINHDSCSDPKNSWAASSMGFLFTRRLPQGFYVIKVAVLSTDCKGSNPQMITMFCPFRIIPTSKKVYFRKITYLPHAPARNGDSSLFQPGPVQSLGPEPSEPS